MVRILVLDAELVYTWCDARGRHPLQSRAVACSRIYIYWYLTLLAYTVNVHCDLTCRRKFRSQTSDLWADAAASARTVRGEKGTEEKESEEKESEEKGPKKRESEKKESVERRCKLAKRWKKREAPCSSNVLGLRGVEK